MGGYANLIDYKVMSKSCFSVRPTNPVFKTRLVGIATEVKTAYTGSIRTSVPSAAAACSALFMPLIMTGAAAFWQASASRASARSAAPVAIRRWSFLFR